MVFLRACRLSRNGNDHQVKRQRDRFRKEALRREREASIAKGNSEQLTRDNQELRKENMHLYKKIRWVPRYSSVMQLYKIRWVLRSLLEY